MPMTPTSVAGAGASGPAVEVKRQTAEKGMGFEQPWRRTNFGTWTSHRSKQRDVLSPLHSRWLWVRPRDHLRQRTAVHCQGIHSDLGHGARQNFVLHHAE